MTEGRIFQIPGECEWQLLSWMESGFEKKCFQVCAGATMYCVAKRGTVLLFRTWVSLSVDFNFCSLLFSCGFLFCEEVKPLCLNAGNVYHRKKASTLHISEPWDFT